MKKPGKGGKRMGAGRPKKEERTRQIRVPESLADWIRANIKKIREMAEAETKDDEAQG
jgi:hypothetical protein